MKKRVLFPIIIIALLLCLFPTFAAAEDTSGSCGKDLTWSFESATGVLSITGSGDMWSYPYYEGYKYYPWYAVREQITSVELPEGLTNIGQYAFYGCKNLLSIYIPDGLTCIEPASFMGCTSITSIDIPGSVKSIGTEAFAACTSLTSTTIQAGVQTISDSAYEGCTSLVDIELPNSLTSISRSAFLNTGFWNSQPDGLVSIGSVLMGYKGVFDGPNLIVSSGTTMIANSAFSSLNSLSSVALPQGVNNIGQNAFYNCSSLTDISIPASLLTVSKNAFSGTGLKDVFFDGTKEMRNQIQVDSGNTCFLSSIWHYSRVDINEETFPDDTFRSWIIAHVAHSGSAEDGFFMTAAQLEAVTAMDCSGQEISDLTGIDFFTELVSLDCSSNGLTSLRLNGNAKLTNLCCSNNPLTTLSIYSPALEVLDCSHANLSSLDLRNQKELKELNCQYNQNLNNVSNLSASLERFNCSHTYMQGISLPNNGSLVSLDCSDSRMHTLQLYSQPNLTTLNCANCALQSLPLDNYPALKELNCSGNALSTLDISQNPALTTLICNEQRLASRTMDHGAQGYLINLAALAGDASRVTLVTEGGDYDPATGRLCFATLPESVEYLFAVGGQQMDVTVPISGAVEQFLEINETNFPDAAFRNYLAHNQTNSGDDVIGRYFDPWQVMVVERIKCPGLGIQSLKGIEYFTELTELDVGFTSDDDTVYVNRISTLDLSHNTKLTSLTCSGNPLTTLNLNKNTKLTSLDCSYCQLTTLSTGKLSKLNYLNCTRNAISSLSITANTNLQILLCDGNRLSKLDVSKNENMVQLSCGSNNLSTLSASNCKYLAYLDCSDNKLSSLSVASNPYLQYLMVDGNQLKTLSVSKNTQLTYLTAEDNSLTSLKIGNNTALTVLGCGSNQISALDLSQNKNLKTVSCGDNRLDHLDLTANTWLKTLYCSGNRLTSLDLRSNKELQILDCSNNLFTNLDLSNNTALVSLRCLGNRLPALELTALSSLEALQCNGQVIRKQVLTETEEGYSYNLSSLVPDTTRVTVTTEEAGYDGDTGIVTFPSEVAAFAYTYATGKGDMSVTVRFEESVVVRFVTSPTAVSVDLQVYEKAAAGGSDRLMTPIQENEYKLIPGSYRYVTVLTYGDGSTETIQKSFTVSEEEAGPLVIPVVGKPWIITQPQDVTVQNGEKATLAVETMNATKFQWYYKSPTATKWTKISTGTKATYTVTGKTTNNGYQYKCVIKNAAGTLTSDIVTLTVDLHPPVITSQTESKTVDSGETVTLNVTVENPGTYQWYYRKTAKGDWTKVSGGTGASYTVAATGAKNGYQYKCVVKNGDGTAKSDVITLTVIAHPPVITSQPQDKAVDSGENATFKVETEYGRTYQWYYRKTSKGDWAKVSGGTNATLTVAATGAKNGYQYKCVVKNADGTAKSGVATLTVTAHPPVITSQPQDKAVDSGENATFKVETEYGRTYQWYYRKTSKGDWAKVSGGTNATLTVAATGAKNGYQYKCVVKNPDGTAKSGVATLTVTAHPPVIKNGPESVTASAGDSVTFTVDVENPGTYQWYYRKNSKADWTKISSGTKATLTVEVTAKKNGYQYKCVVKNADGTAKSGVAKLTVN